MPKKTSKRKAAKPAPRRAPLNESLRPQQPLVSGRWLLSAIGVVLVMAGVCAYAAFCLLFYQGSWQLIFHPSRVVSATPAKVGIAFDDVRFDYTETGKPQLAGWWVPAGTDAQYSNRAILLLHDGHGSLSDSVNQIQALHALGINVFAFDYRGFGQSADLKPSEQSMNQDADAAIAYLTGTRHLPATSIVLFGIGLGAPVAAAAAISHREISAVMLENVSPDARTLFAADARTKLLPVRMLTSDRFNGSETLAHLAVSKLFLERGGSASTEALFHAAGYPKQLFQIGPEDQAQYLDILRRFLDESLQHP